MTLSTADVPTAFRPGYEKGLTVDAKRTEDYVRNTMVADPMADAAMASMAHLDRRAAHLLIEAGVNHRAEDLKKAPRELRDLFDHVNSPPEHVRYHPEIGLEGSRAFFGTVDMFMAAVISKGLVENISTLMGQSFLSTGYSTFQGVQRLRTSLKQVLESMVPGGLEWYGDGWKLTLRARLAHAQGRRIIAEQPGLWDEEEYGAPISMAHVAFATATFSAGVLQALVKLGVRPPREAREGYVHNWRYIGWLLGVPDEILLTDEQDGVNLMKIARICEPPPTVDSIIMAHSMVNSAALALVGKDDEKKLKAMSKEIYRGTRAVIGKELADQLDFPKTQVFGVLAALRWKRRLDRLTGRAPKKEDNFIYLLQGVEAALDDYKLHDGQYA